MTTITIEHLIDTPAPEYATPDAAGADLRAAHNCTIPAGSTKVIGTGVTIAVPQGYEAQVRSRSGLAAKHSLHVLNSPGTIDADYRGEVKVILHNAGRLDYAVRAGERIAQIVFAPVLRAEFVQVKNLTTTERGEGGLGSTGAL